MRDFSNLRALGSAALAGLLCLLLVLVAVETFRSGSPLVRWSVFIVVVAYLGGSFAAWWLGHPLWQLYTWGSKATISFFVLLGLLAVTVRLPGGLSNGLRVLITAAAIAFSGWILFQLKYPHPAIKWTVAGLSAYGAIAFLHGIFTGIPYVELLHGGSLWTKLPFLLQGSFIGALIILPLSVVVVGFRFLREAEARGRWPLQQTIGLSMTFLMVVSGIIAPRYPTLARYAPGKSAAVIKAVSLSSSENTYLDPKRVSTDFKQGIKQIVLWYRWTGANKGHRVNIAWFKDGEVVQIEEEIIEESSGSRSWFLRREKDELLPAGSYQVALFENLNRVTAIPFRIGG